IHAIGRETAVDREGTFGVGGRDTIACGQPVDGLAVQKEEDVRHQDETAARFAREVRYHTFYISVVVYSRQYRFHAERVSRRLERRKVITRLRRGEWVEYDSGALRRWRDILEKFYRFLGQLGFNVDEASDVASGMRQAGDQTAAYGVGYNNENNGNCAC